MQQELGKERGDLVEEGGTEQRQAICLRMKLRHIIRTLWIEDHKTEETLEKNLQERDQLRVTPAKMDGQQEGSGTS